MRAAIRRFEWDDLASADPAVEPVNLVIAAGPAGGPGEERFQISVCTIDALALLVARQGIVIGRHYLFVEVINTKRIEAFLHDRLRRIDGRNWHEVAEKIARIGYWEFEDYTGPPLDQ